MTNAAHRMTPTNEEAYSVGVADLCVIKQETGSIITHALGSCIGITVFDPVAGVGGMLHFMLPAPAVDNEEERPIAMFAATGIPELFRLAYKLGADKERLVVCAAGGAAFLDDKGHYQIGKRNKMMMRKLFWKNGIRLSAEDTGGNIARTMRLVLSSGEVSVRSNQAENTIWTPSI